MTTQEVTTDINSLALQPIPIASQDNERHCLDVIRKHFKNILMDNKVSKRTKNRNWEDLYWISANNEIGTFQMKNGVWQLTTFWVHRWNELWNVKPNSREVNMFWGQFDTVIVKQSKQRPIWHCNRKAVKTKEWSSVFKSTQVKWTR